MDRQGDRLIAEDLLLLLLDDEKGTSDSMVDLTTVLGGALLIELALAGAVEVGAKPGRWGKAKVHVTATGAPDDPVLAQALGRVAERERAADDLVGRLGKGVRDRLTERLAADGLLERREAKVLGLFRRTTWPARDAGHEDDVRRRLAACLVGGQEPDVRTAALVALLHAVGRPHKVIAHEGVSGRDVRRRAKEIAERLAEGGWAAQAVSDAVAAAAAASTAAIIASTTAATVATSSS